LAQRRERWFIKVRFTRRWGPHRIAAYLRMARSTVEAVLRRYQMPLLRDLDQASGLPVRRPRPRRYEHPEPGDLVHLDIKKLGRIPDGGGHRKLGRQAGRRNRTGVGYGYLHHAVDDHSRWLIPRTSTTNAKTPLRSSGDGPTRSSPTTASS